MQVQRKFSCSIIGGGTLPIRCAEILLNSGHNIRCIVSADEAVNQWAKERGIPHLDPMDGRPFSIADSRELLSEQPFDYLFSIVNESILPKDILELPRKGAINYHDALLPRYAGTHATSWALMNKELTHGVTWHVMSDVADTGDILKQRCVQIDSGETAFTLNIKCYETAINSFTELIDDLSRGEASPSKQTLAERTFFPRYKRPAAACVLSWNRCAYDIAAFVRALNFGSYPNPLGLPKLAIGKELIIVPEIAVLDDVISDRSPGTVTAVDLNSVTVSTTSRDVVLRRLLTIDGQPLTIPDFVASFDLTVGSQLGELDSEIARRITRFNSESCKHEAFWVKRLETLQPIELPYVNRKASTQERSRYIRVPLSTPQEVTNFLKDHHQAWSTSDFLLAAYGAYLARLGAVDRFDLGFRDVELRNELAAMEELFAAYVPLRMNIDSSQSFANVFHGVRDEVELVRKHKSYARDVLIRYPALRLAPELERPHMFSAAVERVKTLGDYAAMPGSELTLVIPEHETDCVLIYDARVLDEDRVALILRQFGTFLQSIAADPDAPIADLSLLGKEESQQLLVEWNDTRADYPRNSCIHHLFETQVERTPDAVAAIFEGEQLSYSELNRRANQLARHLKKHGVGAEVRVGICVERSLEMIVGLLGILKAGGAYVPLDPAYPQERLAFMLDDAEVPVLVTQERLMESLPARGAQVVCLDKDWKAIGRESGENLESDAGAENLAYVIYTSGSTGKPKGVQIPNRAVVNFLSAMRERPGIEETDVLLAVTTLSFDIAGLELYLPLITGASVELASRDIAADGRRLAQKLAASGATIMQATPATWRMLLDAGWEGSNELKILCGGEALSSELAQALIIRGSALWNMYGPTETTIWSSADKVEPNGKVVTIGRPIANTQIYVLDKHLQPVPIGMVGELHIGGEGLARGYLNRPELTAEKFITDPFSDVPGSQLYKTGDLARYLPDGNIECVGRIDNQVKIRGFRIELGEIESALGSAAGVRQAVVMATDDSLGSKSLIAYIVPEVKPGPTRLQLRDFLKSQLPEYMIPSFFVYLDELPFTPNGKVDRRALPATDRTEYESDDLYAPPRNSVELKLTKIWENVLAIKRVGASDNFWDLGGTSLLAVRLFSEIDKSFGLNLPLATLFQAPTIRGLAEIVCQDGHSVSWSSLVPIQPNGSNPPFFCMHGAGANVLVFRSLSRRLGEDQPFYGLQALGLDGKEAPHSTVEEMAAHYIKEIRSVQPEGPYFLGGFSMGGMVAFEMAQQLLSQGQKVALLALLDTFLKHRPKYFPEREHESVHPVIAKLGYQLNELIRVGHRKYVAKGKRYIQGRLKKRLRNTSHKFQPPKPDMESPVNLAISETRKTLIQTEKDYVPKVYPGRITLFWGSEVFLRPHQDWRLGWSEFAAEGMEVYVVPGDHSSMRDEPYVAVLAEKLKACIERARVTESSGETETWAKAEVTLQSSAIREEGNLLAHRHSDSHILV